MKVMLRKVNRFLFLKKVISFLAIFFLLQTTFGYFHKHKEENLHFHAENLLTKDHTKLVNLDCAVCPYYFSSGQFNLNSNQWKLILISNFQKMEFSEYSFLARKLYGRKFGRAPPIT